jgi:cyclopropane fatty-acyl-phospholipid synthase-like methyltransferase
MRNLFRPITGWLTNQWIWQGSRLALDLAFGLYRKRFKLLTEWGVLDGSASVLDIGCGSGEYATQCAGPYLGIDLSERYITRAQRRFTDGTKAFRCVDVTTLWQEQRTFDVVLLVDFLHHLPEDAAVEILQKAGRLGLRQVVSFEPIKDQTNRLGQWIVDNDRGQHMRRLDDLHELFRGAELAITQSRELYLGPIRTRAILCQLPAALRIAA